MAFREHEDDEDEEVSLLGEFPNNALQPYPHNIAFTSAMQVIMQQLQSGALRPSTASSSTLADDISSKVWYFRRFPPFLSRDRFLQDPLHCQTRYAR
jgi:hypothetical protein